MAQLNTPTSKVISSMEFTYPAKGEQTSNLDVTFTNGQRRRFYGVTAGTWRSARSVVASGGSLGAYFNRNLRDCYKSRKLKSVG